MTHLLEDRSLSPVVIVTDVHEQSVKRCVLAPPFRDLTATAFLHRQWLVARQCRTAGRNGLRWNNYSLRRTARSQTAWLAFCESSLPTPERMRVAIRRLARKTLMLISSALHA